jgi:O-antigen/teichoic acid export membrane protein
MTTNIAARSGALASLALATLLVARIGGPSSVGVYVLLRILPGIVGLLLSSGLPGAAPYFLAGSNRGDARLRGTLIGIVCVGGVVGTALWILTTPLLGRLFFEDVPSAAVALAGLTVLTQLLFASTKACLQGLDDLSGTNWAIFLEEFLFVPAYLLLGAIGVPGNYAIVLALLLADSLATGMCVVRLARRDFFVAPGRPHLPLARRVCAFGARGQVGNLVSLLNYRLDFVILGALSGPAVLGTYAVASKLAELLRIPAQSLFWVLYPRFAQESADEAESHARRLVPRAGAAVAVGAIPLALLAGFIVPAVYGHSFTPAIIPAQIILVGVAGEGVAGVITAFLYGRGRPGLNSLATGGGLVVTVVLDILLIPRFGAVGAAWASTAAYLTTTALLVLSLQRLARERQRLVAPLADA